jgi:hypothetical protein
MDLDDNLTLLSVVRSVIAGYGHSHCGDYEGFKNGDA